MTLIFKIFYIDGHIYEKEVKGDWYFRISDLVRNADGTDI